MLASAIKDNHLSAALTFNHAFHFSLTQIADMLVLGNLLDSLWMRTGPLIARAYASFNERMAIDHHWEVFEALKQRDGAGARKAICSDILDGSEKMLECVQLEHD